MRTLVLPGGSTGIGFDDLGFAPGLGRILAPAAGTGSLDLVDPASLAVTVIGGFARVAYEGGHDASVTSADEGERRIFATDRTRRRLVVIDPEKSAVVGFAPLSAGPDYVRWVGPTREVWVTEPDAEKIEVFAVETGSSVPKHASEIKVPGGPESLVIDPNRGRAFTHTWNGSTVAIDLRTHSQATKWANGCSGSRGIAIDVTHGYLFTGCADGKATAVALDHPGEKLGAVRTGPGVDIVAYAPKLMHLYVPSAASGTLSIIGVGAGGALSELGRIPVARGSHCVATDDRGHAFVCDPAGGRLLVIDDPFSTHMPTSE